MTFILLAALMVALAAASIAIPFWRKSAVSDSMSAGETGQGVYDAQMGELTSDLESGVLAEPDYASARHDLETEQRLHVRPERRALSTGMFNRWLGLGIAALLILCSGVLYWRMGDWRVGVEGIDAASRVAVVNMVQDLATRLETTDQNDLKGWLMLGHAYVL
ncbi:MAG TPA: c-type cytochrome biogenesis protein CcmI, partial [Gammaproteobacteria bacterium]|nr:c-type cytochrome biogenesis protein CcmI [Gammaproteobacteria bacterium]